MRAAIDRDAATWGGDATRLNASCASPALKADRAFVEIATLGTERRIVALLLPKTEISKIVGDHDGAENVPARRLLRSSSTNFKAVGPAVAASIAIQLSRSIQTASIAFTNAAPTNRETAGVPSMAPTAAVSLQTSSPTPTGAATATAAERNRRLTDFSTH